MRNTWVPRRRKRRLHARAWGARLTLPIMQTSALVAPRPPPTLRVMVLRFLVQIPGQVCGNGSGPKGEQSGTGQVRRRGGRGWAKWGRWGRVAVRWRVNCTCLGHKSRALQRPEGPRAAVCPAGVEPQGHSLLRPRLQRHQRVFLLLTFKVCLNLWAALSYLKFVPGDHHCLFPEPFP